MLDPLSERELDVLYLLAPGASNQEIAQELEVALNHAMLCWTSIFHADVLWQWNRLDEALDLALQAVQLSEQTETIVSLYLGYTLLMRIYLDCGERVECADSSKVSMAC